jgi:hypothetical protein
MKTRVPQYFFEGYQKEGCVSNEKLGGHSCFIIHIRVYDLKVTNKASHSYE